MPRIAMHSRRSRPSCSVIALATVLAVGATPAAAQSFNGTGTYVTNPVVNGIDDSVAGITTITLNPGQTVLNWTPTDNATNTTANIVFQNAGTTATFTSTGNFAVLNNIDSASLSRAIEMNGTVRARVGGLQRGSVYFYAPGGFVLGGGSVFSVGSLVLSALPINHDANGFITNFGTENTVQFGQAPNANAAIVSAGSISANVVTSGVPSSSNSSYVALVAPRVQHTGSISVNGSAALVAAEAATMSFSPDGLFDISVTVGTDDPNGVVVSGDIGGTTPNTVDNQHRVYLVAVPKNDALTMVISNGADLGFTLANNAEIDQYGAVILSAGHDISNGDIGAESAGSNAPANFWFTGAHATNNLFGEATGYADLYSLDSPGQLTTTFDSDVTVHADEHVWMNASGAGTSLTVGGDLSLSTNQFATESGGSAQGGQTSLYALNGGSVTINGNASLSANAFGGSTESSGEAGGTGTGGQVNLQTDDGGTLHILGNVDLEANGTGGDSFSDGNGGAGIGGGLANGGGINITDFGGALTVDGSLEANADGIGGDVFQSGTVGGTGTGGNVTMTADSGGDISVALGTELHADGDGGTSWDEGANGGLGEGGVVNLSATGAGSTLLLAGANVSADGEGGGAGECQTCVASGGDGIGGLVNLSGSSGGTITSNGTVGLSAAGRGGSGATGQAGDGFGGSSDNGGGVFVDLPTGMTLNVTGDLLLDASGEGGFDAGGSTAGNGVGGTAQVHVGGGALNVSDALEVGADGLGGDSGGGGDGGDGTGGWAEILTTGGTLNALNVLIEANGSGGDSFNFNEGPLGDGGDGFGGRARAVAEGGSIHITGNLNMDATATGGSGANGGNAVGIVNPENMQGLPPAALVWAGSEGAELRVDGLTDIDVSATGGAGFDGNGGNASGGEIDIAARLGDIVLGNVIGNAEAFGGDGGFGGGAGGSGTGGAIDVNWSVDESLGLTGSITLGTVNLSVSGYGGDGGEGLFSQEGPGGNGGAGGDGTGGSVSYVGSAGGGTLNAGSTVITADGIGGNGGNGGSGSIGGNGGDGGIGTGGFIQTGTISNELSPTSGGSATFTFLSASASATGGNGGSGGEGFSGLGLGGDGGDAIGGRATFLVRGVEVTADTVSLFANATGGDGGSGSAAGNGGDATAGFIAVESKDRYGHADQRGSLTAGTINGTAIAEGGSGTVAGTSTVIGGSYFQVLNGDANIGTLSLIVAGDEYVDGPTGPDFILAQDGAATIGSFTYDTTGDLAIFTTSTGSITATDMNLSAGNFVDYPFEGALPAPGALFATNLSVTSSGDFIAHANLDVVNGIDITVPGSIRFNNAVSDSFVDLWAQGGSIDIGNVTSASSTSLVADSFITGGNIAAGGAIFAQAFGGDIDLGSLTSTFGSIFVDAAGDVDLGGNALADGDIEVSATGDIIMLNAMAGESVDLSADGNVTALNLTGGDNVDIDAGGAVEVGNLSAGLVNPSTSEGADYRVSILAGGDISTDNIEAAGNIGLATPGAMTTLDINAGGTFIALGHGDMNFGDATASEVFLADFAMSGSGGITVNCIGTCGTLGADGVVTAPPTGSSYLFVTTEGGEPGAGQLEVGGTNGSLYTTSAFDAAAGDDLSFWFNYVTSDGSSFADYAWAALFTTGLDQVAILFTARTQPEGTIVPGFGLPGVEATLNPSSVPIIGGAPEWSPLGTSTNSCFAAGCGYTGWISSTYEIADAGSYVLRFGVTNYLDMGFQSGMAFSGITVGGSPVGTAPIRTGGSITIGNVTTGKFTAAAGTSLTTGMIDSSGSIALDAGGAITTNDLFAGDFVLANGGSITTQDIEANSVDMTSTGGNITVNGDIFAFEAVEMDAFGDMLTGDITAGSIDLLAGGDITTDNLTTQFLQVLAQDGPITTLLFPGASITLEAGGDIDTGNINSIDGVYANAGGSITTGNVDAVDFIWIFAGTDMDLGNLNAGEDIDLESGLNPGSGGNMAFGDVSAGTEFEFDADGNVEGGDVVAGATIEGEASGNVLLGQLTAGFDPGEFIDDDNFSVGIVAEGSINVGNVSGAEDVGFGTLGNLTTGNLSAGDLIMTLVQGNITTGSITTNGEAGQVYMAHASMCETGGGCSEEGDFDPGIVLALEPIATEGAITINGPVDTGLFRAAAGTTLTTQSVSAEDAIAFAGGLAVINGAWTVGDAKITSNDIDITANGSISADGDISLVSKNTTRTVVGDGLNLAGYNLSSAEFGKLSANDVTIIADTSEGATPTMFIGTLNVNAGGFPDGIDYEFLTGNGDTETASGTIRVAGNAVFTGMTSGNHSVNFGTGLFQLVTEIGSISLFSSGSTLGGVLGISANHVHVASASILNQLASNPTYTNYQQDLNETPDVQRPEGVLRADTISIGSGNLQDVLIQNTGTGFQGGTPAGFLARQLLINGGGGTGSINLVINGQVVSEGGTLTGVEARDALVPEGTDITPFTSNSTINGCPLTGVCIIPPPPAPPTVDVVDNFIDIITGDPLGDSDFGNEDAIDDNEEGDQGADNPINPPQPLFDTRPLIPSGDVNDPVSGTGNPALLGSDQQCEEGEQGQCPANPVKGDSQ